MPESTAPTYSIPEQYLSSNADLTLKSSDADEFKVCSYMLKAHSKVFRDMLSDSTLVSNGHSIDIDATSPDLSMFLDYMHKSRVDPPADWAQAQAILQLCDKFECDIVSERVRRRLREGVRTSPWEAFALASQYDDVEIAQWALRALGNDHTRKDLTASNIGARDASMMTLLYLLGYLRLAYQPRTNWNYLGKQFKPGK
ncbi:uncharacterized protein I303_102293 [Kwoniella dejecticola CBS 10117]|uniref:BTB domain-containing protein n=1 Tax=Kwoniella dejecticola CBS 10117 TaxID=1296121 RepID=A0A1A6ABC5_9TREE|nr:uncharacterized protein I303_01567 [Kwoniella dejecticola CBS 10117]OBR87365.1 hypothetical protein I303_01567 [Kwoniella dejecticola CBS 10117]